MSTRFIRTASSLFLLKPLTPETPPTPSATVGHHIMVIDRSGSMWGDIEKLKQSLEQSLAVESMTNEGVLTTLISFSTHGDVTEHWVRIPVSEVLKLDNPYLKKLRAIRASFLTGISQALNLGLKHVRKGETTGMSLFTDGYANSPSSYQENRNLDRFVSDARKVGGLFLNCIGYRSWCDWPRMNAMSNALSGTTVRARSFREVLTVMKDTQTLLSAGVAPATTITPQNDGLLLAINRTTGQVNASHSELNLAGVGANEVVDIYEITEVPATTKAAKGVHAVSREDTYLHGALTMALTSLQDLRKAKEVLFASGNKTLWDAHQSAMTPSTLSDMLEDLIAWVLAGNSDAYEMGRNVRPQYNLFTLADVLNGLPARSVGLDTDRFLSSYRRRSLRRIPGRRDPEGNVIPLAASLQPRGNRVFIRGMKFNTTDASVQLETVRDVDLKLSEGEIVREVQFVDVSRLQDFRSYTVISSGERNVDKIPLRIYTEQAWTALTPFMIPSEVAKGFRPGQLVHIEMRRFRLESDTCPTPSDILALVSSRNQAMARSKALSAMVSKGQASPYSGTQVAALKAVHLTPALYFSPPTMYEYTDRDEAVRKGEIDAYTRYRVNFGTVGILSKKKFKSGNAFLKKRYKVANGETAIAKPTLQGYQNGDTYTVKPRGRGAWTDADDLMATAFDALLLSDERASNEEIVAYLDVATNTINEANDALQGLVMEIGCTGLLPRALEAVATRYEADEFATQFGVKLGKDEKEGIFFTFSGGLVVNIVPETSWYTVQKPQAAAAK